MAADELTRDQLFDGRLTCLQSRAGYRFSQDAVLAAHFVDPQPNDRGLDLGTGCGIISLILAFRWPSIQLTALELQPSLADLARRNVFDNHLAERIQVVEGDWRHPVQGIAPGAFDWVVCNPPYYQLNSGRKNPHPERAIARHEMEGGLTDVLRAA